MNELSSLLRLALAVGAVYRLSQLFYTDYGPKHIFEKLRLFLGVRAAQDPKGWWFDAAELINCPYCLGVWFSIFAAILVLAPSLFGDIILVILGIAGFQTVLQERFGNER